MTGVSGDDSTGALFARWRAEIDALLLEVIDRSRPVALVNFPAHLNLGDLALWVAEVETLRRLGVEIGYQAAWNRFSAATMRRRIGTGQILLNAGGNFGDLYAGQQGLREHILTACGDNPIVQLPQSIHFDERQNAERVNALLERHGNVTLLCRERRSVDLAATLFPSVRAAYCHDLALSLDPRPRPTPADTDVVWLARGDREALAPPPPAEPGMAVVDWHPAPPGTPPWAARARAAAALQARLLPRGDRERPDPLWRAAASTFEPFARAGVDQAMQILARGRVVITNRLHGHVMALLLGIPSVVLDGTYGKVHGVASITTDASPLTHLARSHDDALATARAILRESPS